MLGPPEVHISLKETQEGTEVGVLFLGAEKEVYIFHSKAVGMQVQQGT